MRYSALSPLGLRFPTNYEARHSGPHAVAGAPPLPGPGNAKLNGENRLELRPCPPLATWRWGVGLADRACLPGEVGTWISALLLDLARMGLKKKFFGA